CFVGTGSVFAGGGAWYPYSRLFSAIYFPFFCGGGGTYPPVLGFFGGVLPLGCFLGGIVVSLRSVQAIAEVAAGQVVAPAVAVAVAGADIHAPPRPPRACLVGAEMVGRIPRSTRSGRA